MKVINHFGINFNNALLFTCTEVAVTKRVLYSNVVKLDSCTELLPVDILHVLPLDMLLVGHIAIGDTCKHDTHSTLYGRNEHYYPVFAIITL